MNIFLRAHRASTSAAGLALAVLLVATLSGLQVPTLNLLGGGKSYVPVGVLLPLVGVSALMSFLTNVPAEVEATAVRPVQRYEAIAVSLAVVLSLAVGALLGFIGLQEHAFAATRNLTGYMGLAVLGHRFLGRHAAVVIPLIFAFACMTAGRRAGGHPWPWAWPMFESRHIPATLVALALYLVGLVFLLSKARPMRRAKDGP
ncbi:hypothetical protein ACQP1K_25240 [Sphaerimonospora sp. CA-214678]|uniref:hypothetical protein n=1 Tax=Sphaerimonospora sp. CA-214678 TaxID=3240029 RepID=UPI003D91A465